VKRIGQRAEGRGDVAQFGVAMNHALGQMRQRLHHAAQTGIGRQRAQERLSGDQVPGRLLDRRLRQKQHAVAREEGAAIGSGNPRKKFGISAQTFRQTRGCALGQLRRGAIDDDRDQSRLLGKRRVIGDLKLPPAQIGREQFRTVGVNRDMAGRIDPCPDAQQHGHQQDRPGMAAACEHETRNQRSHADPAVLRARIVLTIGDVLRWHGLRCNG